MNFYCRFWTDPTRSRIKPSGVSISCHYNTAESVAINNNKYFLKHIPLDITSPQSSEIALGVWGSFTLAQLWSRIVKLWKKKIKRRKKKIVANSSIYVYHHPHTFFNQGTALSTWAHLHSNTLSILWHAINVCTLYIQSVPNKCPCSEWKSTQWQQTTKKHTEHRPCFVHCFSTNF